MSMDSFSPREHFLGRLRSKELPGGSVSADLFVTEGAIQAKPAHGAVAELPLRGLKLRRDEGGALVATESSGKISVTSEDPHFLRALETVAGNLLNSELARIQGESVSSRGLHLLGCFLALVVVGLGLWSIPRLFRGSVRMAVASLPTSVDNAIGKSVQEAMDTGGKVLDDPDLIGPLQTILDRLAPHAPLEGVQYQFRVVENEVANAYALPGGYITIFTGLIEASTSPEQVAGVLAHEIVHAQRRHGLHRIAQQAGLYASIAVLVGDLSGLEGIAVKLFTMQQGAQYSQEQETEADLLGVNMLIAAGIDPSGMQEFFRLMQSEHGDGPEAIAWASSHPMFTDRIAAIQDILDTTPMPERFEPLGIDWPALKAAAAR